MDLSQLAIVDWDLNFLDAQVNRYPIFEQRSTAFETALAKCLKNEITKDARFQTHEARYIES